MIFLMTNLLLSQHPIQKMIQMGLKEILTRLWSVSVFALLPQVKRVRSKESRRIQRVRL